jgi:hypothetical protein
VIVIDTSSLIAVLDKEQHRVMSVIGQARATPAKRGGKSRERRTAAGAAFGLFLNACHHRKSHRKSVRAAQSRLLALLPR